MRLLADENDGRRPTACPSAAASAPHKVCQKANDRARAAVGCMGGLGGLATQAHLLPACAYHTGTQSRRHHAPPSAPRPAHDQAEHNGHSARRAVEPRRHNEHQHDDLGTTGAHIRDRRTEPKTGCRPRCPSRPTGWASVAASRPNERSCKNCHERQNSHDLGAERSTACPCWTVAMFRHSSRIERKAQSTAT